ncbi:MAG: phosphoglucosamine mutase [Thalassobium sp.]|nr:MAG: phosphoglucosamine mutase [Thalassobium sp.]
MLTLSLRADLGVVISASHNPYQDNGIKLFGPDGYKLSDDEEAANEALMAGDMLDTKLAPTEALGRAKRLEDAPGRYIEFVKQTFPRGLRLEGLKIVVDCAHGAAYRVAPAVFYELGADVIPIGVDPDGTNINQLCGATDTTMMREQVVLSGADIGIALDGDADRMIVADETAAILDGDQIMALFAARWAAQGRLAQDTLVATVMSNLGLENFLESKDLHLKRTAVGDRHVVAEMRSGGYNLGGEQSGHIVMTDYGTTGDGLAAGLQFLAAMIETGEPASALARSFDTVPQMLKNVRFGEGQDPLGAASVQSAISAAEAAVQGRGRILIRKSGTEPLIRVMAECDDDGLLSQVIDGIVAEITSVTAA